MALYNNGYPMSYQQYYPMQTNVGATQPMQNGIIWVQGEAGAKSYLVAPNNTVQLWDSESQTIYLKSADASGMPSIKTLDYTIRDSNGSSISLDSKFANFPTREEIEELREHIKGIENEIIAIKEVHDNGKPAVRTGLSKWE